MTNKLFLFGIGIALCSKIYGQDFNSVLRPDISKTVTIRPPKIKVDSIIESSSPPDTNVVARSSAQVDQLTYAQLPIKRLKLTSGFGYRVHPVTGENAFHSGIDLSARNDYIFSVLHGIVTASGYNDYLGNFVSINHGNYQTIYGHLTTRYVRTGDIVKAGSLIGLSGTTGRSTGEHLHFSVKYKGIPINPLPFLREILTISHKQELTNLLTSNN